jgi:putative transcriptional regulator
LTKSKVYFTICKVKITKKEDKAITKLLNNLKQFRFNCDNISQEKLAEKLSVSRQTINAIENGKFNPSVMLALEMAKFFGTTVEELFYIKEDDKNE